MIVYCITCLTNGKQYIGITSQSLERRWSGHLTDSRNSHRSICKSIRKYGKDQFVIEPIHEVDNRIDACNLEKLEISVRNTIVPYGYNMTEGGEDVAPRKGYKHTPYTIDKMRASSLGRKKSAQHCAAMSRQRRGKPGDPSKISKMADAVRGKKFKRTPDMILKLRIQRREKAIKDGACWVEKSGIGWRSRISIDGKIINLGTFSTKKQASNEYHRAAHQHLKNMRNELQLNTHSHTTTSKHP